jgi:hypothetical protein
VGGWVGGYFEGIGLWMGWTYAKIFGGPCPHVVASQSCASHNFQASFPSFFFPIQKKKKSHQIPNNIHLKKKNMQTIIEKNLTNN